MGESVLGLGKVPRGWGGGVVSVSELVEVGSHVRGCVNVGDLNTEAGGGQSQAGLPLPPLPSCWPSQLLTTLSLFLLFSIL